MTGEWRMNCETCRRAFYIAGESEVEARGRFTRFHVHVVSEQGPGPAQTSGTAATAIPSAAGQG